MDEFTCSEHSVRKRTYRKRITGKQPCELAYIDTWWQSGYPGPKIGIYARKNKLLQVINRRELFCAALSRTLPTMLLQHCLTINTELPNSINIFVPFTDPEQSKRKDPVTKKS